MKHPLLLLPLLLSLWLTSITTGFCSEPAATGHIPQQAPEGRDAPWHPKGAAEKNEPPVIRKLADGIFQVGQVTVNKVKGFVSVDGEVNMDDGLVEYLACGPMGKLHESVLVLHAQPYHLQVALLLLGLEPGDNPLESQGAPGVPEGDPAEIWVSWRSADQKEVRLRAEELLFNIKEKKAMPKIHWIYAGSQIIDGKFIAQMEQSIVATYHDPFALFDHPLATGTDDTIYYVNKQTVPPKGTPIKLEFRPVTDDTHKTVRPQTMHRSTK
jgi:hypothetical protein